MDYTIKAGDTLSKIAQSQGTTVSALQQANKITNPNLIQAGSKLAIPSIEANQIQTKQAVIPPVKQGTDLNSYITSISNGVQPLQQDVATAEQGVSTAQSDLMTLSKQLEGQTLFQQQQEQQAGIPQLNADYIGLQNQANQLTTEYLNAIRNREAQGGVAAVVGADQKRIQSQAASDIGLLNAQLQAKQGQISLAQGTVDRAISLKYEPIKAQIETGKLFLQQNFDLLSRADKKLAEEKNKQWDLQLKQIEKQEDEEKTLQNMIISASQMQAPGSVIDAAKKAPNILEAAKILGQYSPETLKYELLKEQIKTEKTQRNKIVSDMNINKASVTKPLSGEASKLLSISSGLETDVNSIKAKIDKVGYEKFLRGYLLGTDRETVKLLSNAADKIGRLRSGGAINKDEEARFIAQFASKGDYAFGDANIAKNALDSSCFFFSHLPLSPSI